MKHHRLNGFQRTLDFILACGLAALASAADLKPRELPPPHQTGGMPLLQALKERQTQRNFKTDPLDAQQLSDLLWAAFGINRPAIDHRTAPSAMNSQEVEIYVATRDGLFHYEPKPHRLQPAGDRDLRGLTGGGDFAGVAPVTLIFVADLAKLTKANPDRREFYAATDTGFISQNVYLYCASAGLATVVHDLDRSPLSRAMGLRPDQEIILAQAVGFPLPSTAPAPPTNPK